MVELNSFFFSKVNQPVPAESETFYTSAAVIYRGAAAASWVHAATARMREVCTPVIGGSESRRQDIHSNRTHYIYIHIHISVDHSGSLEVIWFKASWMAMWAPFWTTKKPPLWRCTPVAFLTHMTQYNPTWLVAYLPLRKIWKSVGNIIPNIWENKIHVPTHQPATIHDTGIILVLEILIPRVNCYLILIPKTHLLFQLVWLVVEPTPLKNDGVRQLGWWHSQLNGHS